MGEGTLLPSAMGSSIRTGTTWGTTKMRDFCSRLWERCTDLFNSVLEAPFRPPAVRPRYAEDDLSAAPWARTMRSPYRPRSDEDDLGEFCVVCRLCSYVKVGANPVHYAQTKSRCMAWWWRTHWPSHGLSDLNHCARNDTDCYQCSEGPDCRAFEILDVRVCGGCRRMTAPTTRVRGRRVPMPLML